MGQAVAHYVPSGCGSSGGGSAAANCAAAHATRRCAQRCQRFCIKHQQTCPRGSHGASAGVFALGVLPPMAANFLAVAVSVDVLGKLMLCAIRALCGCCCAPKHLAWRGGLLGCVDNMCIFVRVSIYTAVSAGWCPCV
eukprot:TRINITY_DN1568_c0_g1_i2.p1 TRINITY_DN1568_c0_g1~~TRINITY_DN1568_c0_g1_i2.p1  ORF type:complete len:138 (-),score=15.61 TRINITY_DN1568_c0_g1_i2:174-587(-)